MKAIVNVARGAARETLTLVEREVPVPGLGEVLVRLHVSGVNPSDVKVRSGAQGPMPGDEVIVHNDGAGVIEAIGEGVTTREVGQRVWLYNVNRTIDGLSQGLAGTAADYLVVEESFAVPLPGDVSFEVGACLGVPAMTAWRAVFGNGPVEGQTLLITGGAGAVGYFAIQMATARGATVIATVSSDEKAEVARKAGAEHVLNYKQTDVGEGVVALVGEHQIDRIVDVDFAAHVGLAPRLLSQRGTIGVYASSSDFNPQVPFYPLAFRNTSVDFIFVYSLPFSLKSRAIVDITELLEAGALEPIIAERLAMADCARAHELIEGGQVLGNIVLDVQGM